MGDMADFALDQAMDAEEYHEDARSGLHGPEAAFEAEEYFGNMPGTDRRFCSGFDKPAHDRIRQQQIHASKDWKYFQGKKPFLSSLTGKYLFFSEYKERLHEIAEIEIRDHGFQLAKVSKKAHHSDYVLCLYWKDNSRKDELAKRYASRQNLDIKYRYWKSDESTRAGIYSDEFKGKS